MLFRTFPSIGMNYNVAGEAIDSYFGRAPLYPNAYPFSQTSLYGYGQVVPCALSGKATSVTTLQDMWNRTSVRTLPTAGFTFAVSSSSALDTSAGTGAQTIEVDVLDTNYLPYTYTVTMNGQTKVTDTNLVGTCLRINDIRVKTWGSTNANQGTIYVYDSTDTPASGVPPTATKIFAIVNPSDNFSKQAMYTVPKDYYAVNMNTRGGITDITNTNRSAILTYGRSIATNANGPVWGSFEIGGAISINGPVFVQPEMHIVHDEKSEIRIQAQSSAAATLVTYSDFVLIPKV